MDFYIRPVETGDARGINELRRLPGVFENILGIPSERVKRIEDGINNLDQNQHQFVAVLKSQDGKEIIIGHAGLTVYPNNKPL